MICAMVLGAGASQRMGTQKLLLPWGAKTVIEHIVDKLLASRIDQVLVITGRDHARLALTLANAPVTLVHNNRYAQGMLSSVRCGLRALPETCHGVLVALGDQPTLETPTVDRLLDQFSPHAGIVLPVYQGKQGHPLLFSRTYIPEILAQYEDTGLRGLLQVHDQAIQEVTVDSPTILQDIDTPDDNREQNESADK
jgi:molybdenum cofactor cytidylyltransferase